MFRSRVAVLTLLMRVYRRGDEQDQIELEVRAGIGGQNEMATMRRIERAAVYPDPQRDYLAGVGLTTGAGPQARRVSLSPG